MKTNCNKSCICGGCKLVGTILGIIVGVIIGIIFSLGYTSLIATGIWIAFGLATFFLLYILGALLFGLCSGSCSIIVSCIRQNLGCLLTGIVGTILTTLAALSVSLDTASIAIILLVGLGAFFFTFLIVGIISFIKCAVNCD